VRELRELNVLQPSEQRAEDRSFLELLTKDQRTCIALALRGEKAPKDLALEAWSK